MKHATLQQKGFTLIELSIVLVIIGLIIGGILVGQDLIKAATTRAQITQIEKYNSTVNTFRNKYNGLPGDLLFSSASQFGFPVGANCDGTTLGSRDGNGLIDGGTLSLSISQSEGETLLFWTDLSTAGLIDGVFPGGGAAPVMCRQGTITALSLTPGVNYVGDYFPAAKIGNGNFIYAYEINGQNWFGLAGITGTGGGGANGQLLSSPVIPVTQAYNIDKKLDDGFPTTGTVQALYLNNSVSILTNAPNGNPDTAGTCYNNSMNTYSTNISNGSGPNCALSFKMQGTAR